MIRNKQLINYVLSIGLATLINGCWSSRVYSQTAAVKEVKLTLLSQRSVPVDPPGTKIGDVTVIVDDDLAVRFRLSNCSKENIYYLSTIYAKNPTGYVLYRQPGEKNWRATSPDRGREGSLTGGGYEWRLLAPGKSVQFEFSDLSTRDGEHAISVLVNTQPTHDGRQELISDTFHPINRKQR